MEERAQFRTHYELLGVTCDADEGTIRAAYRRVARAVHPDTGGTDALFSLVNDAYKVLSDRDARARYDLLLARPPPAHQVAGDQSADHHREPADSAAAGPADNRNSRRTVRPPEAHRPAGVHVSGRLQATVMAGAMITMAVGLWTTGTLPTVVGVDAGDQLIFGLRYSGEPGSVPLEGAGWVLLVPLLLVVVRGMVRSWLWRTIACGMQRGEATLWLLSATLLLALLPLLVALESLPLAMIGFVAAWLVRTREPLRGRRRTDAQRRL